MVDLIDLDLDPPLKSDEEIEKLRSMPSDPDATVSTIKGVDELGWLPMRIRSHLKSIITYEIDNYEFDLYRDDPQIGIVYVGPGDICYVIYEPENVPEMVRANREVFIKYLALDE